MANRDVTNTSENADKLVLTAADKAMIIDVSTTPDTLKEAYADSFWTPRYKIVPSVASNNLTVAVKTLAGNDPSATEPLFFKIHDTIYSVTAALSITINAGTNWFNSGGSELATLAVPYFVYVVYDSNSAVVALTIGRKAHYRIVASGMTTTTSENHIYNYANFTDGDNMANIGYLEATLSAGAGYTWTVPTFTGNNLRHEPTYESQWMTWAPTYSASGSLTYTSVTSNVAKYKIASKRLLPSLKATGTLGGSASTALYATLPMDGILASDNPIIGACQTAAVGGWSQLISGTPNTVSFNKYDASNYATSGSCVIKVNGSYEV